MDKGEKERRSVSTPREVYPLRLFSRGCTYQSHGQHTHTHTHPFNGPLSRTTRVSRYQKCKTNLDFTEARNSEWHWHQLGHMQVCTSLQTDNHASTPPLVFLQAGCPSGRPTNSVKVLKAHGQQLYQNQIVSLTSAAKTVSCCLSSAVECELCFLTSLILLAACSDYFNTTDMQT